VKEIRRLKESLGREKSHDMDQVIAMNLIVQNSRPIHRAPWPTVAMDCQRVPEKIGPLVA